MKLKELRKDMGFTQKQLAEIIDVNQQTIARWENGKTEPSIAQLRDLAMVFETSVDAILGKEKPTSLVPKWFHMDKTGNYKDFYYGHLGITLCEGKITKWYPVTEKVAEDFINWNYSLNNRVKMIFETLNNRYVWINLNNISHVTLNHDDCDEPLGDWKLTYKEDFFSEELFKMMTVGELEKSSQFSDKMIKTYNDYCQNNKLSEDDIFELTHYAYFYGKDKMIFDRGCWVEDETYPDLFNSLDEFDTYKTASVKDNDARYIFNLSELAMVDAPKYLVMKAYDEFIKELEK